MSDPIIRIVRVPATRLALNRRKERKVTPGFILQEPGGRPIDINPLPAEEDSCKTRQ